jgi:hypothetical protein
MRTRADYGEYAVQKIPLYQVRPERAGIYYNHSLYADAGYIVTSSSVRSRYYREPARFAAQIAFYDTLEREFEKVMEIDTEDRIGPTIEIYKSRGRPAPFASRASLKGVPRVPYKPDSRAFEADFYSRMGYNYEFYGHLREASDCYVSGLGYSQTSLALMKSLVSGAIRCLTAMGRHDEVPALLDKAIASAPTEAARNEFRRMKRNSRPGGR